MWTAFVEFLVDTGLIEQTPTDIDALYTNDFLP